VGSAGVPGEDAQVVAVKEGPWHLFRLDSRDERIS